MKLNFSTLLLIPFVSSSAFANGPLTVKSKGRAPASELKVKSSQVPTFDLYHKRVVNGKTEVFAVKNIPALDVGQERQVASGDLSPVPVLPLRNLKLNPVKQHTSIPLLTFKLPPIANPITEVKKITSDQAFSQIPDVKVLPPVAAPKINDPQEQVIALDDLKANDYKLLQALIFLEMKKEYEMAMGLFAELIEDPTHRLEALYHYAMTAKGLGLNSEFRQYMLDVVNEAKDVTWKQKATQALVQHIKVLETSDIALIDPLVKKFDIDTTRNDDYNYIRAKHFADKGKLTEMEESLIMIGDKSPRYKESLLLQAVSKYRQGKIDDAIPYLQILMSATAGEKKSELRSVGALTLARIQFQKSDYKDAFKSYLMVEKSNPLWLQAMVESAWTQILGEDYEGAAGNMFSLHTDFFKNAFSPESYVVRTVGYLNLCQYGDGMQVLKEMSTKYKPWRTKLDAYVKANNKSTQYYDTVKRWVQNSDLKEVDGLPRSFIVELARHPAFTSVQQQINTYEDEINRFNRITLNLIKKEREVLQIQNEASRILADLKSKGRSPASSEYEKAEGKLMAARIQHHIAKKARTSIKNLRAAGLARINKEKEVLRLQASHALKTRFDNLNADLNRVLSQNEVLEYELFSGAGEHIRYQMAGGDITDKDRPELKVEKEKSLNWKFRGEIWEDEVGHYRSSLKNVCPQETVAGLTEQ